MRKNLIALCIHINLFCISLWAGEWVMFSDGRDTYIYSTNTGEIYIRHQMGKKNYEDTFVKMPHGIQPNELKNPQKDSFYMPSSTEKERAKQIQLDALKKSQDLLNATIE